MNIQLLTAAVLTLTAVIWLALELWQVFTHQAPISVFLKDAGVKYMFLPYGWGVLGGHFFLTYGMNQSPFGDKPYWWLGWVVIAVALILSDIFLAGAVRATLPGWLRILRTPYLMLMVGLAAGLLFWPQRVEL